MTLPGEIATSDETGWGGKGGGYEALRLSRKAKTIKVCGAMKYVSFIFIAQHA